MNFIQKYNNPVNHFITTLIRNADGTWNLSVIFTYNKEKEEKSQSKMTPKAFKKTIAKAFKKLINRLKIVLL